MIAAIPLGSFAPINFIRARTIPQPVGRHIPAKSPEPGEGAEALANFAISGI